MMFPLLCVFALALAVIPGSVANGMVTPGYCLNNKLQDQNKGVKYLGTTENAVECFNKCRAKVGKGCEWSKNKRCYLHTEEVLVGNGNPYYVCLVTKMNAIVQDSTTSYSY
eukprot:GFUD01023613.1.p1 GENE.GFUD01023613.1~~GFUD01023613.1.p1  ORF type:complete len:111 (+),score=20.66 GFUD01023613.1:103-435(+)